MAKSLEFKGHAKLGKGKKKKRFSKTSKEGPWFCPTKVPFPFFLVFLFFHSTSPSLLCVPLVAFMQVMKTLFSSFPNFAQPLNSKDLATMLACCHFAITNIIFGHREEKGERGACCLLASMGLWLCYHTIDYNNSTTYYSSVREKKEGKGVPSSNFLYVCVCVCFFFTVVFSGSGGGCNKEGRRKRWKEGGEVE